MYRSVKVCMQFHSKIKCCVFFGLAFRLTAVMAKIPTGVFMGVQVAGSVVLMGVGAYTAIPAFAPFYTRRFYQQYNPDQTPLEVNDHTLTLVDNVSRQSLWQYDYVSLTIISL